MDAGNWEVFAEIIMRLVGNIGFPIVCVIIMFWQMYEDKKARVEERSQWLAAITDITAAINELSAKIKGV